MIYQNENANQTLNRSENKKIFLSAIVIKNIESSLKRVLKCSGYLSSESSFTVFFQVILIVTEQFVMSDLRLI